MPDVKQLQDLRNRLTSYIEPTGFSLFSDFAERHGSWEITFDRTDAMHRYVTIDFTSSGLKQFRGQRYDVEVWIGAELGDSFARRMVGQFTSWDDQFQSQEFEARLRETVQRAISETLAIREDNLVEHYKKSIFAKKAEFFSREQ
jgi:hypothetical protein